jgi:hypothetical protein
MLSLGTGLYSAQAPLIFAPEKMLAKIDLPRSMQTWESHKAQIVFYKEQRGGTVPQTVRLSSRIGMPILLAMSGLVINENPRIHTMQMETMTLLAECVSQTGQDAAEALAYWALRGLRRGRDMGWERI